jgi:hypothetical protein
VITDHGKPGNSFIQERGGADKETAARLKQGGKR